MASGKKNYFRHSVNARNDEKIVTLIANHGKEAYFHYMALVEMCAQKAINEDMKGDETFIFHRRTVCSELMVTPRRLGGHLLAIQSSHLGDLVATLEKVSVRFPNLVKYLGRYESKITSNSPNKRKEKEIKEKEIKVIKNKLLEFSQLSILFKPEDEIQSWLLTGSEAAQKELLEKHSHHVLAEEIKKAYLWQCEKKPRKAGSFLITWMGNKNTAAFNPNQAQARFKNQSNGITPTPQNPTGNPYTAERIAKGEIA
jgi:hypothetical protein